jgi:hypothetical protein
MDELIEEASRFATQAQGRIHHRRALVGQAFGEHLRAVAKLVGGVTDDPATLAAAWLHDVVEDTPSTFHDIEDAFGRDVADLVSEVSDVSRASDGELAVRQAIDCAHLAAASSCAQTIKLADLIDTCRDICKHHPGQAKPFVIEMAAQLGVLSEGHPEILKQASNQLEKSAQELGVPLVSGSTAGETPLKAPWARDPRQQRTWSVFASAFTTGDIARPLRTFDATQPASEIAGVMDELGLDVVGVREQGETRGYARLVDLKNGTLGECSRVIDARRRIDAGAPLSEMVRLLTQHNYGFVVSLGGVNGLVTRSDVQQPVVRMWLFGMITLIEVTISDRISERWPDGDWMEHLTPSRRAKAAELKEERIRRGQPCELIDCLQVGDKASILLKDPAEVTAFGFQSKKTAQRVIQEFQSLRNNLAHSQDIVTHDWPQIARMTARVEGMLAQR